jgi:hypothetical protein
MIKLKKETYVLNKNFTGKKSATFSYWGTKLAN